MFRVYIFYLWEVVQIFQRESIFHSKISSGGSLFIKELYCSGGTNFGGPFLPQQSHDWLLLSLLPRLAQWYTHSINKHTTVSNSTGPGPPAAMPIIAGVSNTAVSEWWGEWRSEDKYWYNGVERRLR